MCLPMNLEAYPASLPTNLRTYESIYEPTFVPTDVPTDVTFVPPYANQEFNKRERNKRRKISRLRLYIGMGVAQW